MDVKVILGLVASLALVGGCGTGLDLKGQARAKCPTVTAAEFDASYANFVLSEQNGLNRSDLLANVASFCEGETVFDLPSECRTCVRAIIDAAFGIIP